MAVEAPVWRLHRGAELLGEIHVDDADFPWLSGRFVQTPAFAEVKPLFDAELQLSEKEEDFDVEAWESAHARIRATLTLASPDGHDVAEFLLHIQGDEAWFRWSDEPFDAP